MGGGGGGQMSGTQKFAYQKCLKEIRPFTFSHAKILVGRGGPEGGRKQVNKALHTCTSWSAYAAMFGSSFNALCPHGAHS